MLAAALDAAGLTRAVIGLGDADLYRQLLEELEVGAAPRERLLACLATHDLVGLEAELARVELSAAEREALRLIPSLRGGPEVIERGAGARRRGHRTGNRAPGGDVRGAALARGRRPGPARPRPAARPRLLHGRDPRGLRPGARPRARRWRPLRRAHGTVRAPAARRPASPSISSASTSRRPRRESSEGRRRVRPGHARRGRPGLKLAVPRGALFAGALDLLDAIGIETADARGDSRALVFDAGELTLVTMRPSDVPTYVEAGAADLGITGKDVLVEQHDRAVYELLDLGFGRCRMVLACRRGDRAPGRVRAPAGRDADRDQVPADRASATSRKPAARSS